jgi:hypothetical protein
MLSKFDCRVAPRKKRQGGAGIGVNPKNKAGLTKRNTQYANGKPEVMMRTQNNKLPIGIVRSGQQPSKRTGGHHLCGWKARTLFRVIVAAGVPIFAIGRALATQDTALPALATAAQVNPGPTNTTDFQFKQAETHKSARERRQEAIQRVNALQNGQPIPEPSSAVITAPVTPTPGMQTQSRAAAARDGRKPGRGH